MKRDPIQPGAPIKLQGRLWLMMVFVLLPAVGYVGTRTWLERNQARAQAQANLLRLTQLAAAGQQQTLAELQRALALSAAQAAVQAAVQGGPAAACSARLAEIAAQFPQTSGLAVWSVSGDLLCADRVPPGPANATVEAWFRQAVAQRAFAIGDFETKAQNGPPTLDLGYPITGSTQQLAGVIATGVDLTQLFQTPGTLPWPEDAHITVFDPAGNVLASSAPGEDWGGGPAMNDGTSLAALLASGANSLEHTGADGVRRVYAFTPATGPGGHRVYVSIGRPAVEVFGPADTTLAVGLAITSGLTVLALLLAGYWGRQTLVQPVKAVLASAEQLAGGDRAPSQGPEPTGSEVERLSAAINILAGRLEQGEADRSSAREATEKLEQSRARAAQLEAVAASVSTPLTPTELIEVLLRQGGGAAGARAATLVLLSDDGGWLNQAASVGYSDQITRLFQKFPVSAPVPAADAVRTGEAVWIETAATYRARYPRLTEVIDATDYEAAAALPLRYGGRTIGALSLGFAEAVTFTDDRRAFLVTLASLCAQALERARLQSGRLAKASEPEAPARPQVGER